MSNRYLSQVRQELAMRLLARVYADRPTPSKVSLISRIWRLVVMLTVYSGGLALQRENLWASLYDGHHAVASNDIK